MTRMTTTTLIELTPEEASHLLDLIEVAIRSGVPARADLHNLIAEAAIPSPFEVVGSVVVCSCGCGATMPDDGRWECGQVR